MIQTAQIDPQVLEKRRLQTLSSMRILDTPKEERFDRITRLLTRLFSVPVSGISLVDRNRIWYKSVQGLLNIELPRENSFENEVLRSQDLYLVEDTGVDGLYTKNPLVTSGPNLKFYAGAPIKIEDRNIIGVLFIADRISRRLSEIERETLRDLAEWVQLEIGCSNLFYTRGEDIDKIRQDLIVKNREVEASKAKIEVMLENIGDGVIGINNKGEIIFINKQVEILTGWREEELMGKSLIHSIKLIDGQGNEVPVSERPIRNALYSNKKVISNSYYYQRKDGSQFAVSITATPVVVYGLVIGGIDVFRDVTKEREVDRMKTEFISLASHQLRTPLSAIKWFTEMLVDGEMGSLNAEQKELVENIYQSNERMIGLVNTLLNISRIESGRIIIDPEPTDIKTLVDQVVLELQPKIQKKNHKLIVSVHGELPKIKIDPKLTRHVYMNLLTNAIKYTPEGGEIVVLISKSGNEIISQISDNGFGIPKRDQEKVFTKFFRSKNIIGIETDGTGLGLYLTKAIVDSSGGKIWFESEEGKGTTFWFILPSLGISSKDGEVSLDS